jgi:hypothetical protein
MRKQLLEELHEYFKNIADRRSEKEEYLFQQIKEELPYFPVTVLHREDLDRQGFDTSCLSDEQMEAIADKMAGAYCELGFWTDLEIIAEEYAGVPKKADK